MVQAEDVSTAAVKEHAAKRSKIESGDACVVTCATAGTAASTVEVMLSTYT